MTILRNPAARAYAALRRATQIRRLVGHWPATPSEVKEARWSRLVEELEERPSARIRQREREAELREFRAFRDAFLRVR